MTLMGWFTNVTPLGWVIMIMCIFVGIAIGQFIFKRFPNLFSVDRKTKKIIKNPDLLVEKLKSSGKINDMGKEFVIEVGKDKETGQDVVVVEERETKKAKKIQKEIIEKVEKKKPKTKKKVKKKKVKKK